jgi:hypothetical protein
MYRKNHKKHIVDYLQRYVTGTTKDIAAALPKHKRTPTSYSVICQATSKLLAEGLIRRVAPGTYASLVAEVPPMTAMSDRDEAMGPILRLLAASPNKATPKQEVYDFMQLMGVDQATTQVKLRKLRVLGVVDKRGSSWYLTPMATKAAEWHNGSFEPAAPIQLDPIGKMPSRKGIAGEPVPAANILRKHALQRERTPIAFFAQPKPTQPEEFTVPTPGRESSIFD